MTSTLKLEAQALLDTPDLFSTSISQNGRHVAWVWQNKDQFTNIYVRRAGGQPQRLTDDTRNHLLICWAADAEHLLVKAECSNQHHELLLIDTREGGKVRRINAAGLERFDHAQLDASLQHLYLSVTDQASTVVVKVDLKTEQMTTLFEVPWAELITPRLDVSGEYLMWSATRFDEPGSAVYLVKTSNGGIKTIATFEPGLQIRTNWHRDGEHLIVVVDHPQKTHKRVASLSWRTGTLHWLLDDPTHMPEFAFNPPGTDLICITEVHMAKTECVLIELRTGRLLPFKIDGFQAVPSGFNDANQQWWAMVYNAQHPVDVVDVCLDDLGTGTIIGSVTGLWNHLGYTQNDLHTCEDITWTSLDGQHIHGYLYRHSMNRGTVVLIHPGPHEVSVPKFDAQVQYLVGKGFNVFEPNYRGSVGYGVAFRNAIYEGGWGSLDQQDIRSGIQHLLETNIARRGRIAVMGYSYGGYSALCQATYVSPDLVNAAVSINGMSDLVADYEFATPALQLQITMGLGGTPQDIMNKYLARSPVRYVASLKAAVMLVHGLNDTNVHPVNHTQMMAAMRAHEKQVVELSFEGEGHTIQKRNNFTAMMQRIEEFLRQAFYRGYNELG
jgi:alpha/beta superfamily hydrolase